MKNRLTSFYSHDHNPELVSKSGVFFDNYNQTEIIASIPYEKYKNHGAENEPKLNMINIINVLHSKVQVTTTIPRPTLNYY